MVSGHVGSDPEGGLVARCVSRVFIRVRGKGEKLIIRMNRDLVHAQGPIREVRSDSDDLGEKSFGSAVTVMRSPMRFKCCIRDAVGDYEICSIRIQPRLDYRALNLC